MSGAWLLCGMLCLRAASPSPASAQAAMAADQAYWYEDIHKPFFIETRGDDGSISMVSQRPRSWPQLFPKRKLPQTARVFILGGSVAYQYDSDAGQSRGWTLQKVLEKARPGKRYEIIHCGMGGYDSYREDLVLREILRYDPDIIVLLSGNNEVSGVSGPPPTRWRNLFRKKDADLAGGPLQFGLQVDRFDRTVRGMVRLAKERHVTMVLCTMPRQLGLAPAGPLPRTSTFLQAWTLAQEGRWAEAEETFRRYIQERPRDSFGTYWLGKLLEKRGDPAGARREYERALREDTSRVLEINDRIRRIAGEEGAVMADVEKIFKDASPGPGNGDFVYDAMHWNRFADPLVSLAIAQALGNVSLPALWSEFKRLKPTDQERADIFRRKALGAVWDSSLGEGFFNERSVGILESLCRDQPLWCRDLLSRKDDFSGHLGVWTESRRQEWNSRWAFGLAHVGEAYRRLGHHKEALIYFEEARKAGCSLPIVQVHRALAQKALDGKGKSIRQIIFEAYGRQSVSLNPAEAGGKTEDKAGDKAEDPRYSLALAHQQRREFKAALNLLEQLIREHPSTAKYFNDRGVCRYLDGNADGAIEDFRLAMKLDPGLLSAYSSLGAIYTARKRLAEAAETYDLAMARNPNKTSDPQMETIRLARKAVFPRARN